VEAACVAVICGHNRSSHLHTLTQPKMPSSSAAIVLALCALGASASSFTLPGKKDALLDLIPKRARGGNLFKNAVKRAGASAVFTNSTVNWFDQTVDHEETGERVVIPSTKMVPGL